MPNLSLPDHSLPNLALADPVRRMQRDVQASAMLLLWIAPLAQAWLAVRTGMGWELVTLLGVSLAVAAQFSRNSRGADTRRTVTLALVATAALLAAATDHAAALRPLPFLVLALVGMMCDRRALGTGFAALVATELAPLIGRPRDFTAELLGLLAIQAAILAVLQGRLQRPTGNRRITLLLPWRALPPARPAPTPLLVQLDRDQSGALRLAVAVAAGSGQTTRIRAAQP